MKRKDIVPLNTPSILLTLSPVSIRSLSVEITGKPAPTDDSWKTFAPDVSAAEKMAFHKAYGPENAFLLGVIILTPRLRNKG